MTTLAYLQVSGNYSSVVLSEYVPQLSSSVEVIGAVIVTNGTCYLEEPSIEMNVSTREPKSLGIVMLWFQGVLIALAL